MEAVQGLTGRVETRSNNTRGSGVSHTFFGKSNSGGIAELQAGNWNCKMYNKQHGVWACKEFKKLEVSKRYDFAKKMKLCFHCLGEGHLGQHCYQYCYQTKVCGLNGCQEVHHRLLHKVENKNLDAFVSEHTLSKGESGKYQQEKNMNKLQGAISHEVPASPDEEEFKHWNDTTMMSKSVGNCGNIALRTIPVYLKSGNQKLKVNALLDDASTKTYVNADVL